MLLPIILLPLSLPLLVFGSPVLDVEHGPQRPYSLRKPSLRPLLLWHGMGDSHSSPGMVQFQEEIKKIHPGIFTHSIYIDEDEQEDRRAGFYGNVDEQLEGVAQQLADVPELQGGFDAIGFSQGGQFLRAYVERYNNPPIRNLITFGSQHMGISDLPLCKPYDLLCQLARGAARGGVYRKWAQDHLVQAQYYRDPDQLPLYFDSNHFLTDINNELSHNETYAANLASLDKLVLILFAQDKTVVPKETAWFGSYAPLDGEYRLEDYYREQQLGLEKEHGSFAVYWRNLGVGIWNELRSNGNGGGEEDSDYSRTRTEDRTIIPMRAQPLYTEDRIGLRKLDEEGRVELLSCDGEHMQLARECWEPVVRKYVGKGV